MDAQSTLWPPTFDAAIFDFDGTISETSHLWRMVDEAFLGARGIAFTADYARDLTTMGFVRGALYTIERYGLDDKPEDIVAEWGSLSRALYRTQVELRPGARDYLLALRSLNIPCALATSNDESVLDSMEKIDLSELFDVRVHGSEVERPKTEPDIYLEAARRLCTAPERCIVFEDLAAGIRAAKRAGMLTCALWTEDPAHDWDEARACADIGLRSWEELELN